MFRLINRLYNDWMSTKFYILAGNYKAILMTQCVSNANLKLFGLQSLTFCYENNFKIKYVNKSVMSLKFDFLGNASLWSLSG